MRSESASGISDKMLQTVDNKQKLPMPSQTHTSCRQRGLQVVLLRRTGRMSNEKTQRKGHNGITHTHTLAHREL